MRWFVEVSRVGEDTGSNKYCVEAKQWQAALQETRKLRGDTGPLSKFSIELMDNGYRAVDPAARIRYVVNKAPADAPLTVANGSSARPAPAASEPAPRTDVMSSRPSTAPATAPQPSKPRPAITVPDDVVPRPPVASRPAPAPAKPTPAPPGPSAHPTQRSMEAPRAPDFQLIRKREEEPKADTPIHYREYSYAVSPGTSRQAVEVLLWSRFREVQSSLAALPPGKFVQLAVFDHVFESRPLRAPLATLAWKDWRGEPVIQVFDAATAAPTPAPAPVAQAASAPAPASAPAAKAAPAVEAKPAPAPVAVAPPAPAQPAPAAKPASGFPAPPSQSAPATKPAEKVASKPQRRRGEDLIGELFETMHDLHFVTDIVAGADFVLGVLKQTLPCEAVIVHIFDINTNQFVVVRAAVPHLDKVLLQRTPDRDPFADKVMRRMRAQRFDSADSDPAFTGGRWELAGVKVENALAAPVHLGGRYLGMIELVNPTGGGPFHDPEANALDYICEQFAEFLANRPIVLDADVVIAKR